MHLYALYPGVLNIQTPCYYALVCSISRGTQYSDPVLLCTCMLYIQGYSIFRPRATMHLYALYPGVLNIQTPCYYALVCSISRPGYSIFRPRATMHLYALYPGVLNIQTPCYYALVCSISRPGYSIFRPRATMHLYALYPGVLNIQTPCYYALVCSISRGIQYSAPLLPPFSLCALLIKDIHSGLTQSIGN